MAAAKETKLVRARIPRRRLTRWKSQICSRIPVLFGRYMRALGTNGTILAVGDASSIQGVKMPTTGQV